MLVLMASRTAVCLTHCALIHFWWNYLLHLSHHPVLVLVWTVTDTMGHHFRESHTAANCESAWIPCQPRNILRDAAALLLGQRSMLLDPWQTEGSCHSNGKQPHCHPFVFVRLCSPVSSGGHLLECVHGVQVVVIYLYHRKILPVLGGTVVFHEQCHLS